MDQVTNEELQTDIEPKPRQRRERHNAHIAIPLPAFLSRIGEDVRWYYDVRLWSPLILLLLILALLPGRQPKAEQAETMPEIIETAPVMTLPEVETAPPAKSVDPDTEALARLAESVGANRSDNVKSVIMWVAINRSEDRSNGYGQSLIDEIARPNQWQGYDENIPYTEETYQLAEKVMETVRTGSLRPLDSDMLWFVLNDNGSITVRNAFTAFAGRKWVEKTVR